MKRFYLGTAALIALGFATAAANAADLAAAPYKAPPMVAAPVPVYDWSGFYIGANGGGGWTDDCRDLVAPNTNFLGCYTAMGATVGGQIGYRMQMQQWVFGLEAQGNWADISGAGANLGNLQNNRLGTRIDGFGTFTGQFGYAWNNVLLYAKGGAAVVNQALDFIDLADYGIKASSHFGTRWGGVAGAGFEVGLGRNWSIGFEYDHMFLNHHDFVIYDANGARSNQNTYNGGSDVDTAMVRLNYKFGGQIVARY